MTDATAQDWDARVERGLAKLPDRLHAAVAWLREPSRLWARIPAALLLVVGGLLAFLPVLGLWMLPLGLALIAEDVPGLKPWLERAARAIERLWHRLVARFRGGSAG
ncbi:hypothetical protein [Methylobacterium oryzihabitans]|uniref:Transmembrane protein (PGPGW) n=1 Tax=Methylobacterium oryzihabitans TaxID=2499852 RepID=A0A3S3U332_9HYPH|nr:hypothetical protein [Methylobacterium oryzihabitans]RVU14373.1 hypothetical protein EOE48_23375 [Methylobacterium oryzihabitans]